MLFKNTKFTFFVFFIYFYICSSINCEENNTLGRSVGSVTSKFTAEMQKKHQLKCVGSGGGGQNGINLLSLHFENESVLDLAEARILITDCAKEFLYSINTNENIRPHLLDYPFTSINVLLMFTFRKHLKHPPPDKIAAISLCDGKIRYSICNPKTQHLQKIYEETYDEALQIALKGKSINDSDSSTINSNSQSP